MGDHYILKGKESVPADLMTWAEWFEQNRAARRVASDERDDVRISTVFLGLDHGSGDGPPLIFETMVFGGVNDGDTYRYSTWEQAEQGHANVRSRVLSGEPHE